MVQLKCIRPECLALVFEFYAENQLWMSWSQGVCPVPGFKVKYGIENNVFFKQAKDHKYTDVIAV